MIHTDCNETPIKIESQLFFFEIWKETIYTLQIRRFLISHIPSTSNRNSTLSTSF